MKDSLRSYTISSPQAYLDIATPVFSVIERYEHDYIFTQSVSGLPDSLKNLFTSYVTGGTVSPSIKSFLTIIRFIFATLNIIVYPCFSANFIPASNENP